MSIQSRRADISWVDDLSRSDFAELVQLVDKHTSSQKKQARIASQPEGEAKDVVTATVSSNVLSLQLAGLVDSTGSAY